MFGNRKYNRRFHPLKVMFFILVGLCILSLVGFIVMMLWNNILVEVTNVKPVNFWQATGLLVLIRILFGGISRGGKRHQIHKEKWRNKWNSKWKDKWLNMSEEERKAFKSKWKGHCKSRNQNDDFV